MKSTQSETGVKYPQVKEHFSTLLQLLLEQIEPYSVQLKNSLLMQKGCTFALTFLEKK